MTSNSRAFSSIPRATASTQRASIESTADTCQGVAFARSTGLPASMGKSTCTVKTLVPDCVADDLNKLARESGSTLSDFLRDMILVRLYGVDLVNSMQRRRLEMAAGIGTESVGA